MRAKAPESVLAGHRMAVDQQFQERLAASPFTSQQWGLVMTAVEFDIADPADPEAATLVPDTSRLGHVADEVAAAGDRADAVGPSPDAGNDGGFLGRVREALGGGGSPGLDDGEQAAVEDLLEDYASALQERLEAAGDWERAREVAAARAAQQAAEGEAEPAPDAAEEMATDAGTTADDADVTDPGVASDDDADDGAQSG